MKKIFLLLLVICFIVSCKKEPVNISSNELPLLVFDETMVCLPISTSEGFYFISKLDTAVYFSLIGTDGKLTHLANINSYLPPNATLDSVSDLTLQKSAIADHILFSCTFNTTVNSMPETGIKVLILNKKGNLVNQFSSTIPKFFFTIFSFSKIFETPDGKIIVYSTNEGKQSNISVITYQKSTYTLQNGLVSVANLYFSPFLNSKINDVLLDNGNLVVFTGSASINPGSGGGPGGGALKYTSIVFNKISPNGQVTSVPLDLTFASISSVYQTGDTIIVSGIEDQTQLSTTALFLKMNSLGAIIYKKSTAFNEMLSVLNINSTQNGYYFCGLDKQFRTIGDIFKDIDTDEYMISFKTDKSFNKEWNVVFPSSFSTVGVSVLPLTDGNVLWLSTIKSFGTYKNIVLLKTNSLGELTIL